MYPSYLARIASTAERACAMALDRPNDPQAREQLFNALGSVADPTFQATGPDFDHLIDLFDQARVWADIVRTRITGLRTNKLGQPAVKAVQFPARDLLPILRDLSRELGARRLLGVDTGPDGPAESQSDSASRFVDQRAPAYQPEADSTPRAINRALRRLRQLPEEVVANKKGPSRSRSRS
jgi:hypothetical protein